LTELLYIIIWGFGIFFFVRIIQKPELIYLFPYIVSFGFAVFILPQIYAIYEKHIFSPSGINRLLFMTILCWTMSFLGWYTYSPKVAIFTGFFHNKIEKDTLGKIAMMFVFLGIVFNFIAFRKFSTEQFENQQASGLITIYVFLQQLLFLGSGLCLVLGLQKPRSIIMYVGILGIMYGFYIGIFQGKRSIALYTAFVLGVPLYLKYNFKPSRVIVVCSLLIAFFIIPSMDEYRRILKAANNTSELVQGISSIDFGKNVHNSFANAESIELANAGHMINRTYQTGEYKIGLDYWNQLIFRFVPAQLVGKQFKNSLMLYDSPFASGKRISTTTYNSEYIVGSTFTGIGDSFLQFDYFGCLFFFLIGMFMKKMWFTIQSTKNNFVQVLYSILLIESVVSLTHGTVWFLPGFISALIFLSLAHRFSLK
jgi:hypothetical protein